MLDGGPDPLQEGALLKGRCGLLPNYFGHLLQFPPYVKHAAALPCEIYDTFFD